MHCNWGWGGQGNGYYLFNVFDMQYLDPHKTRATYNSNISAYVNISPKNKIDIMQRVIVTLCIISIPFFNRFLKVFKDKLKDRYSF